MKRLVILSLLVVGLLAIACTKTAPVVEYKKFAKDSDVPRITTAEAKKDYDSGVAVMVDTRPQPAYDNAHIAGAISIPFGTGEDKFSTLPQGKKIILYCDWPAEHTSAGLAFQMNQKGIANVYALVGGTNGWKSAGYPMESAKPQ